MTTDRPNILRDVSPAVWIAAAVLLMAGAIFVHAIFPRYTYQVIDSGRVLVIYDRWAGKFQRANYDEKGEPSLTRVLTPF